MAEESHNCLNVLPIYPSCGTMKTSPEFSPSTSCLLYTSKYSKQNSSQKQDFILGMGSVGIVLFVCNGDFLSTFDNYQGPVCPDQSAKGHFLLYKYTYQMCIRDRLQSLGCSFPDTTKQNCDLARETATLSRLGSSEKEVMTSDRKSTRLNSSHITRSRMPSSA